MATELDHLWSSEGLPRSLRVCKGLRASIDRRFERFRATEPPIGVRAFADRAARCGLLCAARSAARAPSPPDGRVALCPTPVVSA
jgi:hypothetical protein